MKDKWEKLNNLLDEYEIVEGLDKKAIEQIKEKNQQKIKKRFSWKSFSYGAIAVVIAFAIALPIYFSTRNLSPEIKYYDETNIIVTETVDLPNDIAQNNIKAKCLDLVNSLNQVAITTDTNKFAYFAQNGLYINENGFDQVLLYVAVLKHASFDFEKDYVDLIEKSTINNIEVIYVSENQFSENKIKAKFDHNDYRYYLEITTGGNVEEKINFYVSLLTT